PELAVAVTRLLSAVPVSHTLTDGQGLRSAVHDSGIFLENRLAQALSRDKTAPTTAMPRDWKAALLRFRDQLTQLRVNLAGSTGPKQAPAALPGSGTAQVIRAAPATSTATRPASVQVTPAVITTQTTAPTSTATPNLPLASTPMPAAAISNAPSSVPAAATQPISAQSVALAVPPPMRHALPHAQPVAQPPVLPTDLLSLVGELIGNSDGALARVRLNQLASVTPEHNNRLVWLLELPVRHDDNRAEIVALRIEKEGEGQSAEQNAAWTADLAFDLGTKGELRARVALRAGRISVSFWADVESTRSEVNEKLSGLQDTMEKKQLDVGCLSCGAGRPADPPAPQASLLETQA
ncbi:MAG: flagellar hook-length control protein FliK, partial [Gammaproteobacteria bacterium]|nr:flagellar hook-length control protein FliK [Gammaproteobacteria bacterium]